MKVIVYGTKVCHWCTVVKDWLKEHNIEFTYKDVNEDHDAAKEMIEKSQQGGVPVIDIDGVIIVGFNENALRETLDI